MDKQTLSHYGLVLVSTVIIVVILALLSPLTPFGSSVETAINNTTDQYRQQTKIETLENVHETVEHDASAETVHTVIINYLNENGVSIKETETQNVTHGTLISFSLPGYTIENYQGSQMVTKDTVFDLICVPIKYSIVFKTNGGTILTDFPQYYTNESGAITLPINVFKEGYTFMGWYSTSNFAGSPVTTFDTSSTTGEVTFYAQWAH